MGSWKQQVAFARTDFARGSGLDASHNECCVNYWRCNIYRHHNSMSSCKMTQFNANFTIQLHTRTRVLSSVNLPIFDSCYWTVRVVSILWLEISIIVTVVQRFPTNGIHLAKVFNWKRQIFTCKQQVFRMASCSHCWWWFAAVCYPTRLTEASNWIRMSPAWFCNHCSVMSDRYPCSICPCWSFPVFFANIIVINQISWIN